jgi:hypothetical protein
MKITFGKEGNDSNFIRNGFGEPEDGFRWTDKDRAELVFFVAGKDSSSEDITVSMDVFPFAVGDLKMQRVDIFIDGEKTEAWSIDRPTWKELKLPAKPDDSSYSIEFRLPDATTPKALGINDDTRLLGIALREIQFAIADVFSSDDIRIISEDTTESEDIPLNNVIDLSMPDSAKITFGAGGNDSDYLRDGFDEPEVRE